MLLLLQRQAFSHAAVADAVAAAAAAVAAAVIAADAAAAAAAAAAECKRSLQGDVFLKSSSSSTVSLRSGQIQQREHIRRHPMWVRAA